MKYHFGSLTMIRGKHVKFSIETKLLSTNKSQPIYQPSYHVVIIQYQYHHLLAKTKLNN